ncbi:hypothetical protein HYPBUDRAFT_157978 [Hyphopichia burtonii NRRL Y-1933]|uniref:HRQ family protein n=1 Tax=Hyphopichia burtonii NRRL Y-1933 TaxID=984485 RepID=A0A1E4RF98_9ASCO|nr:hypothetical protein HYPBUDRAFT_157978 [Hyphopichia burtonii NRRL Y-1933]ODV65928.1 hypothetical protein HYPBUDRAFT_157978 [Hyphopichia burtonii NRRL Y-1933]
MLDTNALILLGGLVICLLLSHKQITALYKKIDTGYLKKYLSFSPSSSPAGSRKNSSYGAKLEPLPKPTPLMITPEQVKNYDDRPWRPFRWPYHQTMSIFKLDINHWLDMDKYYWHYIQEKERIWLKYGKENIDWLPGSEDACFELMETVVEHMTARYPLLFTVLEDKGSDGKIIKNELTKEVLDMTLPLKENPLIYVSKLAKEDFYIVKKNPEDGKHYLVAAAVPFPGGSFGIDHKIGKHLDVIHDDVPYYHEKLKKSMERWFERLAPENPVERASWYISWDHKLKVSNVYRIPKFEADTVADINSTDPKEFNVRVERQTLRRLPKSQAIIFTNHPVFYSIEEMKNEPLVPSLIKKIIYEGPKDIIKYKNFEVLRDHISTYLDSLIKRQIDKGIIKEDTPLKTLPTYPFAYWAKTDFDFVNGWLNPTVDKKKFDYSATAKDELVYEDD